MRKLFKLNLWPTEEMQKKKQYLKQQQMAADAEEAGNVVVDGVDGGNGSPHGKGDQGGKVFGIRNYLHQFYFLTSPTNVEGHEIIVGGSGNSANTSGAWYLLPPPPAQRMGLYVCRLMTVLGLLLLLGGATAIIVGYCWPRFYGATDGDSSMEASLMRIAIDQDEEGNFYIPPERLAEILRDPMHGVKISGFCVFAIGASIMALSLLVPTLAQCAGTSRLAAFASEDNTPNEPPIRIYPGGGGGNTMGGPPQKFRVMPAKISGQGHKISPTGGPVPVMEEIAKVQPPTGGAGGGKKSPSSSPSDLLSGGGGVDKVPLI